MSLSLRAVVCALCVALVACGQVDPVLMPVGMPECIYRGPSSMGAGNASVSLNLNGIGDAGVVLARLTGQETHVDLERHLESVEGRWEDRPDWIDGLVELRLDSGQGVDGVEETVSLPEGDYALICVDYSGPEPTARIASAITVESS